MDKEAIFKAELFSQYSEIFQLIKKKAEEKYRGLPQLREPYILGHIEAIEIMIGFVEWLQYNFDFDEDGNYAGFYFKKMGGDTNYTIVELLEEYIKIKEVLSK